MLTGLRLRPSPPLTNRRQPPPPILFRPLQCALTKQGERFLHSLSAVADDSTAVNRLIRKFISGSPKSVALTTLSHLLSPHPSTPRHLTLLALPMYRRIAEETWFDWNPKLTAELIALLESQSRFDDVAILVSEAVLRLGSKERELVMFYSNLINSKMKFNLTDGFDAEGKLREMILKSKSVYVKQRAYEALIGALSGTERVGEAEKLVEEMRRGGMKVGVFELRSVVYGYGRVGMFEEMERSVGEMETEGFEVDTVCANMVLSAYGARREFKEMAMCVRRMRDRGVGLSVRTYNTVLNACGKVMGLVGEVKSVPLSVEELMEVVEGDEEGVLVREMVMDVGVLGEVMEWSAAEGKLDLHGMHLGTAYLVVLQWMEELRVRWGSGEGVVPAEIVVVCGVGRHSVARGESPVKELVKAMMVRMRSPLRLDRKNVGCFIAKGKAVKTWLC